MPATVQENSQLTFRRLHDSPMIVVHDYICRHSHGGQSAEEESEMDSIVLMRHGAFTKHFGKRKATADVNQATFFSKNSIYRVSHPGDCGDRGTTFMVRPNILRDIVRELDPTVDDRPSAPFPFVNGPCSSEIYWRHREYVNKLESGEPLEHLWADVTGLQLVADVLEDAYRHAGREISRRTSTLTDHVERTELAKAFLTANLGEVVTLDDVSRAVNASPFNFARIFRQQTGTPVHRYLTILRLRAALEKIADPKIEITEIAFSLGFSSHSHFTDVFRKEFGRTPSEIRKTTRLSSIRQMSKDLIA